MTLNQKTEAFSLLGSFLKDYLHLKSNSNDLALFHKDFEILDQLVHKSSILNPWHVQSDILFALQSISDNLEFEIINTWVGNYSIYEKKEASLNVGIVMAGNIPLVGFYDFFYVLMSGNNALVKLSSQDELLLPFLTQKLIDFEPSFQNRVQFVNKLAGFDAVIATGSGNSSRYFEYYFSNVPNIIRKNRNSCALISGKETAEEMQCLGKDIFTYFGGGCRNVSKIWIPENYDMSHFYEPLSAYSDVLTNNKYANNYDYNKAMFLVKSIPFLDNGFLLLRQEDSLAAPRAVIHYEYYKNYEDLDIKLQILKDELQCIAGNENYFVKTSQKLLTFGTTQFPQLHDYADNVDVMRFLMSSESKK